MTGAGMSALVHGLTTVQQWTHYDSAVRTAILQSVLRNWKLVQAVVLLRSQVHLNSQHPAAAAAAAAAVVAAPDTDTLLCAQAARLILSQVSQAYGLMILGEGLFQADGHPGNIMVQRGGRVALLDYGQSKQLEETDKLAFADLILAMNR
jgi:hypothetical protein